MNLDPIYHIEEKEKRFIMAHRFGGFSPSSPGLVSFELGRGRTPW